MASAYVGRPLPELVMVASCYLDDSHQERRSGIAGYVAPLGIWDHRFVPVWRALLESSLHPISEYKACDIRHMDEDFSPEKGWTREETREYAIRAVRTLADTSRVPELYGFGAATIVPHVTDEAYRKDWEDWCLTVCFLMILINVASFVGRWRPRVSRLQVVHDEQPGLEPQLYRTFKAAKQMMADDCDFDISNLQFEDSKEVLPIQAADILAYETRKELKSRLEEPQRPRSRALIHLMENRAHAGFFVDYEAVQRAKDQRDALPPILYESDDAEDAFPWLEHLRERVLDPPPLMPD